ncbi:hypothetical protein C8Q73DRAFT_788679 [Cubamyces lactineus]|nr:hypothetical protein C8Q73DRAFT_788679 [Cubamyces lactineus]
MFWLQIFRFVALGWGLFCSLLLLGLGAHALSVLVNSNVPTPAWAGLAVATAVLSFVTLPPMLVIDLLRTGAFSSMIVVELAWLSFIGLLCLATGGAAAENAADFWVTCGTWTPASARSVCSETSAAAAFGFLGWLALWGYTITLLVLLILHANRGHYVWRMSVKEAGFENGIPPAGGEAKAHEAASLNAAQVPYAYPPSGTPYGQPAAHPSPYPQV